MSDVHGEQSSGLLKTTQNTRSSTRSEMAETPHLIVWRDVAVHPTIPSFGLSLINFNPFRRSKSTSLCFAAR
jgi:hypothetical protein